MPDAAALAMCTLQATEPAEWVAPGPRFRLALRTYSPVDGGTSWPLDLVTTEPRDADLGGACSTLLPMTFVSRNASLPRPRSMAIAEGAIVDAATRKEPPRFADVPGRDEVAFDRDNCLAPCLDAMLKLLPVVGVSIASRLWKLVQSRAS